MASPRVLVVDDSKIDRMMVEGLLSDLEIETVADGATALERLETEPPDVVVTDLFMPEMDGLQVVAEVRERFHSIPVILMTSQGSEEIAVRALQAGAASYVPKAQLTEHLRLTIDDVVQLAQRAREEESLIASMRRSEFEFVLATDDTLVRQLARHLQDAVLQLGLRNRREATQIGVAIHEAVNNAAEHGNLETASELRETDLSGYFAQLEERRRTPPYCDRRVHVEATLDREEGRIVVRDEGPGFDPSTLPDPREPKNLEKLSGRGVLLMRTFMDEVTYNEKGNEVTMVLRRR